MNIKRPLPKTSSPGYQREIFSSRNELADLSSAPQKISKAQKVSRSLEARFAKDEGQGPKLNDEIPSEVVSYLVEESRALISSPAPTRVHWNALAEFLALELRGFIELKKQMNEAQRDCENVLKIAEEVCDPANEVSPNRVLEVALSLQEAKMRRDNLRARVKLIIDELSAEILAGIGSNSLEIQLRGVLGKLR